MQILRYLCNWAVDARPVRVDRIPDVDTGKYLCAGMLLSPTRNLGMIATGLTSGFKVRVAKAWSTACEGIYALRVRRPQNAHARFS